MNFLKKFGLISLCFFISLNPQSLEAEQANLFKVQRKTIKRPFYQSKSSSPALLRLFARAEAFFDLLLTDEMIFRKQSFTYTKDNLDQIRANLRNTNFDKGLLVSFRYFKSSTTVAYHDDWVVYFNLAKMNRSECEKINTLVHETFHALSYSHGDDSSIGKENSVPYWMGDKAEELCRQGKL